VQMIIERELRRRAKHHPLVIDGACRGADTLGHLAAR